MPVMVLMVRSACPSHEVGAIGNYMGKGHGRHPGQLIVSNGFPRSSQLCNNLGHLDRIPHHHGIRQQTETGGLVHDLVVIAGLKSPLGNSAKVTLVDFWGWPTRGMFGIRVIFPRTEERLKRSTLLDDKPKFACL